MLRRILGLLWQDVVSEDFLFRLVGMVLVAVFAVALTFLFNGEDGPIQEKLTSGPVAWQVFYWACACIVFAVAAPLAAGMVCVVAYTIPCGVIRYARSVAKRACRRSEVS